MKASIRSFIPLIALVLTIGANAQISKVEEALEDDNCKRVIKLCEKYVDDKEIRKDPYLYFYYAQGLYDCSLDPLFFEKNPDLIKDAIKMIEKGIKKDDDSTVKEDFLELIDNIAAKQNELAMDQYNINKLSKANKMYGQSYDLNKNRVAYLMMGKTFIEDYDSVQGEYVYRNLIALYNQDTASDEEVIQEMDPFIYFINKNWLRKDYDSAMLYLTNARELFGSNRKIDFYQKSIGMEQINNMPPSSLMMEYIQNNLELFPTDTNFLHKENALYIYMIKNHIASERYGEADALIQKFAAEKVYRSASEDVKMLKLGDDFIEDKSTNVLWKLSEYFYTYGHIPSAKYILKSYIKQTAVDSTPAAVQKRWGVIADYAFKSKPLTFASFVLQESIANTKDNKALIDMRSKVIAEKENSGLNVDEMAALFDLAKADYKIKKTPDNLKRIDRMGDKYIGLLVKNHRFGIGQQVLRDLQIYNPEGDYEERKFYLAKEDFYQNYFLTKTKGKDAEGNEVDLFIWDGSISSCETGTIAPEIQEKVANRINYFRRNAGVPEVFFDDVTNEYCQKAALMMEANNKLDHEPTKSWRCYSGDGAYAAKHSLLVKDANTSIAVTSLMADQENPTAGNRRWLLYPNGKFYGHGSTEHYAVIWALDDSGAMDTSYYEQNFVCWPPNDYVPELMIFKHWSFSIYQDLTDATVSITLDGKPVEVKLEKYVEGYGAPTLVFTPKIDKSTLKERSNFKVTVTLSNGSKYSYTVKAFDYDPAKV